MELLRIAQGDLESAVGLSQLTAGRPENIVFLAQQAVEKFVKSVLVHHGIAFPLLHDLGVLVALLPDEKMPIEGFELMELNPFASIRRHHEGDLPLTREEIEATLKVARNIAAWAKTHTSA
jgi:HEPN domain-containing protein